MAAPPGKRKLSIYLPDHVLREMEAESRRLDRPLSWLIHRSWRIGYPYMVAERKERELRKARGGKP
jgi:uncharacterized small protein (TIGR04563 family)